MQTTRYGLIDWKGNNNNVSRFSIIAKSFRSRSLSQAAAAAAALCVIKNLFNARYFMSRCRLKRYSNIVGKSRM